MTLRWLWQAQPSSQPELVKLRLASRVSIWAKQPSATGGSEDLLLRVIGRLRLPPRAQRTIGRSPRTPTGLLGSAVASAAGFDGLARGLRVRLTSPPGGHDRVNAALSKRLARFARTGAP